jgi:hypothetical protein
VDECKPLPITERVHDYDFRGSRPGRRALSGGTLRFAPLLSRRHLMEEPRGTRDEDGEDGDNENAVEDEGDEGSPKVILRPSACP